MRLKDVMTEKVAKISPIEPPARADALMRLHGIHHLVVFEDGRVAGLVTAADLARADAAKAASVAQIMARDVKVAPPTCTVKQAANLLRGSSAGALPVVDRGRLVGIVTVSDLLELLGRGAERPVEKGQRWTLRSRARRPHRPPAGLPR
jgi:CBS domain-containing protein